MRKKERSSSDNLLLLIILLCCAPLVGSSQITSNVDQGCAPLIGVEFSHFFTGATGILWDFGDGSSSTAESPSHTYTDPDSYTVVFTADGGINETLTIDVLDSPQASFSIVGESSGCLPFTVFFQDESTEAPGATLVSWTWDFGDGGVTSGPDPTPSHTYTLIGINDVSLVVEDNNGCEASFVIENAVITSIPPDLTVSSNPTNTSSCEAPFFVDFGASASSNSVLTDALTYAWDMGNGTTTDLIDPPGVTYTENGSYPVSITVTDDIGCSTTENISVFVGSPQAAWETVGGPEFCDTVVFASTSDAATTLIEWGDTDPDLNLAFAPDTLIHVYDNPGTYTASITVSSPGCASTDEVTIIIEDLESSFVSSPNFSCVPFLTVTYENTIPGMDEYMWTFPGTPDTLYGETVDYTHFSQSVIDPYFTDALTMHGATLTITSPSGCTDSFTAMNDSILVPYAGYYVDQTEGCAPLTVMFSDTSDSVTEIVNWEWHLGDGTIIDLDNMDDPLEHTYTDYGEYEPFLVVTTVDGCVDTSFVVDVNVGTELSPQATFGPIQVCPFEEVDFSAVLFPDFEVDYWSIESDGNEFSSCTDDTAPSGGFSSYAGMHDVTIYSNYNGCIGATTYLDAIELLGPVGHFHLQTSCDQPFEVNCIGDITGADSWTYDFGDGTVVSSSSDPNATHTYSSTGDYTITLTSIGSDGCGPFVETRDVFIRDIQAELSLSSESACEGGQISLDALLSQDVHQDCAEGYLWSFDDELAQAPYRTDVPGTSITIDETGTYDLELVVQDINGCTDTASTVVSTYGIEANFDYDVISLCLPMDVQFNDLSIGDTTIVAWDWTFGDGENSSLQSPSNIYTEDEGTFFFIDLIVTDILGCEDDITLTIDPTIPNATFSANDTQLCVGDSVEFSANVTGYDSYSWDFGNGIISDTSSITVPYNESGSFTVSLSIIDSEGCEDEVLQNGFVNVQDYPEVGFSTNVDDLDHLCYPILIEFTDTSIVSIFDYRDWDLGTGFPVVDAPMVGTIYEAPGTYLVSLEVGTTFGCVSDYEQEFIIEGPVGDFIMSEEEICLYESVDLQLSDTVGVSAFMWDFGNGADSANVDPVTYTYSEIPFGGSTLIQLVMWSGDSTCSATTQYPFTVNQTIAEFDRNLELTMEDTIHCFGLTDQFNNLSIDANSYIWEFGNGEISNAFSPSYDYPVGGEYDITLYAFNMNTGCSDTITKWIKIHPEMVVGAEDGLACRGDTIWLQSFGGVDYQWSPPDEVSDPSIPDPWIADDIDHDLTVLITDINDCSQELEVNADFILEPAFPTWTDTIIEFGEELDFGYESELYHYYDWQDESGIVCLGCSEEGFSPYGDETYTLIITDQLNCYVDTFYFGVVVEGDMLFFMPNSFTPNNDGVNDLFYPVTTRVLPDDYEFTIWNRFGEVIWSTEELGEKWNGGPTGSNYYSENEVYTWQVHIRDLKRAPHVFRGSVVVMR